MRLISFSDVAHAIADLVPSFKALANRNMTQAQAISLLGFAAGLFTTFGLVPQVIKVIQTGDTEAISLGMYIIFFIGLCLWLAFGIALNNTWIQIWNILSILFAGIILGYKVYNTYFLMKDTTYQSESHYSINVSIKRPPQGGLFLLP